MRNYFLLLLLSVLLSVKSLAQSDLQPGVPWGSWEHWGQQGQTYYNPILPADFSDLDCIKVGNTYYAISSTFQYAPGQLIMQSKDLVNWEIVTHAVPDITQIGPEMNWDRMDRYGRGIWAGSIRYHKGRFYVFFCTPDEGYFMTSASRIEGPWDKLTNLLAGPGWDDCSAIWDEEGQGWFVGTRFAATGKEEAYKTYLFRLSPDGKSIDRQTAVPVNSGNHREANKLIRVGGWYYLIFSEHQDGIGRYVMAKRARQMEGPWSEAKQLAHANKEAMEPNQGGIIQGPDRKWYFFTHHGTGQWEGRAASLLPVTWVNEWPIIGAVGKDQIGRMVWSGKMPGPAGKPLNQTILDRFNGPELNPNFEWNYQPDAGKWSLTQRRGWLRLYAAAPLEPNRFRKIPNILTQRVYRTRENEVSVKADPGAMTDGQVAGLCNYGRSHCYLGVSAVADSLYLVFNLNGKEQVLKNISGIKNIWLRCNWGRSGFSRYAYSLDGKKYIDLNISYPFTWGDYRGNRVGLFSFSPTGRGYVDFDYFRYEKK